MHTLYKQSLAAATAAVLVFACGSKDKQQAKAPSSSTQTTASYSAPYGTTQQQAQPQQQPQPQAQQPQQPMSGAGGPQDTTTTTGTGTPSPEATSTTTTTQATMEAKKVNTTLSDGDILGVENAIHNGEIKLAELARKRAQHAQVKNLAGTILTQHRDAQTKAKDLAKKNNITATDNDVSNKLKTEVSTAESDLKNRKGRDFDTSYIDEQVKMHTEVVDIIDNQLLPSAKNDALKGHLNTMRGFLSDHLSKAQDIQSKLGAVGTTSTTSGTTTGAGKAKGTTQPKPKDTTQEKKQDKSNK